MLKHNRNIYVCICIWAEFLVFSRWRCTSAAVSWSRSSYLSTTPSTFLSTLTSHRQSGAMLTSLFTGCWLLHWVRTFFTQVTHSHTQMGNRTSCLCQTVLRLYVVGDGEEKRRIEQSSLRSHIELMLCFLFLPLFASPSSRFVSVFSLVSLMLIICMYVWMQTVGLSCSCQQRKSRNRHRTVMTKRLCQSESRSSALSSSLESLWRWVEESQNAVSKRDKWKIFDVPVLL